MIKVYIPIEKNKKNKPIARGFWKNENGKIYYDYIVILEYDKIKHSDLLRSLQIAKRNYNQEAIFYTINNIGHIYYNHKKIDILKHRAYKQIFNLKQDIKKAINKFGGCTVYKINNNYFLEAFYNGKI